MSDIIQKLENDIIRGREITKNDALELTNAPLDELRHTADRLRMRFCGNIFDMCSIINAKSGLCSENCKYCAQSSFYNTGAEEYSLLDSDSIISLAKYNSKRGVPRYSLVTSGRKISDAETDLICSIIKLLKKDINISICGSFGLLDYEQFLKLKQAGLERVHNNLETSRSNFPNVCTTHTYDDKINAVQNAKKAGLEVCSGGIIGLGETIEDRIDMALDIRKLQIRSIPINILNPIPGTPYENNKKLSYDDILRTIAIFRFINPYAFIRMSGGRGNLPDKGKKCFISGANAAITGDMLTTSGISIENDKIIISELGYEVVKVK